MERIAMRRGQFEAFVEANTNSHLYGITTRHHYGASTVLSPAEREAYNKHLPATPASVGPPMPERLLRGIILARLATFLDGHSGVRPDAVDAVARMLEEPLPYVPERGHGEPGEIVVLGHLFRHLENHVEFGVGGAMPLVNGSPAAAAALADASLAGRRRLGAAEHVFALAAAAIGAPLEHYDGALADLWGDEYEAAALARARELLGDDYVSRRRFQAPVSFRNAPRLLGWTRRLQAQAEECAVISLRAVTGNPIFLFPEQRPPHGAVLSNGSYLNPMVAPLLNGLARAWADLAQLATHQVERLVEDPDGLLSREIESRTTLFYMTQTGWAEEARHASVATLMSLGGTGQTDTSTPDLLAWRLASEAGRALDVTLAGLAVVAAHTLALCDRRVPAGLMQLSDEVLSALPPDAPPAHYGAGLAALSDWMLAPEPGGAPDARFREGDTGAGDGRPGDPRREVWPGV
jgi:histidine ammonia-lyase